MPTPLASAGASPSHPSGQLLSYDFPASASRSGEELPDVLMHPFSPSESGVRSFKSALPPQTQLFTPVVSPKLEAKLQQLHQLQVLQLHMEQEQEEAAAAAAAAAAARQQMDM